MGALTTAEVRECSLCKAEKPVFDFPVTRGKVFRQCKQCCYARSKAWAERNRERSRSIKQAYSKRYPEREAESKRKCYEAGRERYISAASERKARLRNEINASYRKQYAIDPTPFLVREKRRKEREAAAEGRFTRLDEQILMAKQGGRCAGCRVEIGGPVKYHADHIVPLVSGGSHWPENRQLLCVPCNHKKGIRSDSEWRKVA